jgi:hypothetical protein
MTGPTAVSMGWDKLAPRELIEQTFRGRMRYCCPSWRRDLHCELYSGKRSCVNSLGASTQLTALFERDTRLTTLVPETEKPFDLLAEGFFQKTVEATGRLLNFL